MDKKRIGFFSTDVPPEPPFTETRMYRGGGGGKSLLDMVVNLDKNKYRLTVFSVGSSKEIQYESPYEGLELYRYPNSYDIFERLYTNPGNYFSTKFFYLPAEKDLDLIHCQLGYPSCAISSLIYKKQHKDVPLVLSLRDTPTKMYGSTFRRLFFTAYLKLVYKKIIEVSDRIVILSKNMLDEIEFLEQYKHKVNIVPNGVDFKTFSKYSSEKIDRLKSIEVEDIKLLFVGDLVENKGIKTLLKAFEMFIERYPRSTLTFAGEGDLKDFIIKRSSERGYSDSISLEGYVRDKDKLAKMYSEADLLVLPSLAEGYPRVVLESMAAATPPLVSDIGTNMASIDYGSCGFYAKVSDPVDFAEEMEKFARMDINKKVGLCRKVRDRARSHSWKAVAREMEGIYDELLQ